MAEDTVVCGCGCGGKASAITTDGRPRRFIHGHNGSRWQGGTSVIGNGYVIQRERRKKNGRYEHVVVAERALGRALPPGSQVHHMDGDKTNNRPSNLVICQDQKYHQLLHMRAEALRATGDANKRRCSYCLRWDDPRQLTVGRGAPYHKACAASRARFARTFDRSSGQTLSAAWRASIDLDATADRFEELWQAHLAGRPA